MCILFHKWSKWEMYTEKSQFENMKEVAKTVGSIIKKDQPIPSYLFIKEHKQKRICAKCNKVQIERVY